MLHENENEIKIASKLLMYSGTRSGSSLSEVIISTSEACSNLRRRQKWELQTASVQTDFASEGL